MPIFFIMPFLAAFALGVAVVVFMIAFAFIRRPVTDANRFGKASDTRGLFQAIARGFIRGLDIQGRANRIDFWTFAVFVAVLCCLPPVILFWAAIYGGSDRISWCLLSLILYPLLAAPSLTMAIRRLHDVNRSGWWLLLLLAFGYFILLYWFCQPPVAEAEAADIF